jgi:hypothetical protein
MAKPVFREGKKPYSTPRLTVYGTIHKLTQINATKGNPDGRGSGSNKFFTTPGA